MFEYKVKMLKLKNLLMMSKIEIMDYRLGNIGFLENTSSFLGRKWLYGFVWSVFYARFSRNEL